MRKKINDILKLALSRQEDFQVTPSARPDFGHYSTNIALRLAKEEGKPPLEVAEAVAAAVRRAAPEKVFEKIEVAPPGFVNFWLSKETIREAFGSIIRAGRRFGGSEEGRGQKILLEYSSVNVAKPMHVGHLRNTFLGDSLARIHSALGYEVVRWNYIGDWGTQFGKLISAYKLWGEKEAIAKDPIRVMLELYVRFHEEEKKDEKLSDLAREEFRKLEEGDKENRRLWAWFKKLSLDEFNEAYRQLGVKFDVELGESFFEPELKAALAQLQEKGLAKESEGGLIVPLEKAGLPPALVRKSDGTSLYLTRDIANLQYRLAKYDPAKILYVVGNEQALHFEQLFAIADLLGLAAGKELTHVKYGLVLGEEGKRFSTREGTAVFAEEVIQKAMGLARKTIQDKNPGLSHREREAAANAIGIGALKYANLKENRLSDITFDWKKMLDLGGDSAPYIQYTHARLRSILRKAGRLTRYFGRADTSTLTENCEIDLILRMNELPEAVRAAAANYAPNLLANYLYELATAANRFYETEPILKDDNRSRRNTRLSLVETTAAVLSSGLSLLGIEAPEKM